MHFTKTLSIAISISFLLFSMQLIHEFIHAQKSFEILGYTFKIDAVFFIYAYILIAGSFGIVLYGFRLMNQFVQFLLDWNKLLLFNLSSFACIFSLLYILDFSYDEIEFLIPSLLCFLIFGNLETYIINKK